MNEAEPSPINLDELRLLPDWLREEGPPPSKQYAGHAGGTSDEPGARRGPRPGSMNRGGGQQRDNRGFGRAGGGMGGGGDRRRDGGGRPSSGPRREMDRPPRDERRPEPSQAAAPAPLHVEFQPDEKCLASITKQIRATHMAYPLFGLARMFLQEPARHWVQLTVPPGAAPEGTMLYQLGEDGPVTMDRAVLERIAFDSAKDRYYTEQTEQKEPPKGNFTNVARNRLSGTLFGPTNYHGYQPALRAEYESRFSRRMSFEDYRRNVEVVSDPALVERWKEEARTTTSIITREGEPPTALPSVSEARAHFRQHYFDQLLRTATSFKIHGSVARHLPEPAVMQAIRQAHETELRYPAQFVQLLRQGLQNAGLHIFKHRKRVVYVSLARPTPFSADGAVSDNVAAILKTVAQHPLCTRKTLAEQVLAHRPAASAPSTLPAEQQPGSTGPEVTSLSDDPAMDTDVVASAQTLESTSAPAEAVTPTASGPDVSPSADAPVPAAQSKAAPTDDPFAKAKAALAADLRFLVQAGHLIEFHNGTFDLPLPPRPQGEAPSVAAKSTGKAPDTAEKTETAPAASAADPDAQEAERAALTIGSVEIPALDDPSDTEPVPSLESGIEKTEAQMIGEPGHADSPGISANETHQVTPDPVVIGDAESAHPLSPL